MNFEVLEEYSSRIDSMSSYSKGGEDQFICLEKDGGFTTDILNIYFSIDNIPDKKWMINIKQYITMTDLCIEITKYLQDNFEEYYGISSLKVSNIIDAESNAILPLEGSVSEYLCDNSEIVCHLESLDIWINLVMQLKNGYKATQVCVKMKLENHISILQVKNICQKLGIIFWNKLCEEYNDSPMSDSREVTTDHKHVMNSLNFYSQNSPNKLSLKDADKNRNAIKTPKSIDNNGIFGKNILDSVELEHSCSKYLNLPTIEEESKGEFALRIPQTQEDDFSIEPFRKEKLFVLEEFECKKLVRTQCRYTITTHNDMFEDRLEDLKAFSSSTIEELKDVENDSVTDDQILVKQVLKNNDTIKCIASFKSVEEATKEQGMIKKTRERMFSRDNDDLCKSPVVCNSPGRTKRRRRKSELCGLECSEIGRSKRNKSFHSEISIEEKEQTCVYANIIVRKGARTLSKSTPHESHQFCTNRDGETISSDESDSESSHLLKVEESPSKQNFFSKFALKLGLKKTEPSKKKQLEIKDDVLSRYELERTPMPLLKNFIIQNIDSSFISSGKKLHNGSNFMGNRSSTPTRTCCRECTIF
ncbi:unnamed protein product [Moneuplotes crassus]|uniref:Uncharacterized protein n=1 Tax=Euplotes crassus TaxID=5936 RepID=A0AAD2DAK4_EUPCR|nr:unnamed protein product [Moneuplotes crassus]